MPTSMGSKDYDVIITSVDGVQQASTLSLLPQGVQVISHDRHVVHTFPYQSVVRWTPSHLRTLKPGQMNSLDLEVETDQDPMVLRLTFDSEDTVTAVMDDLRTHVKDTGSQEREKGDAMVAFCGPDKLPQVEVAIWAVLLVHLGVAGSLYQFCLLKEMGAGQAMMGLLRAPNVGEEPIEETSTTPGGASCQLGTGDPLLSDGHCQDRPEDNMVGGNKVAFESRPSLDHGGQHLSGLGSTVLSASPEKNPQGPMVPRPTCQRFTVPMPKYFAPGNRLASKEVDLNLTRKVDLSLLGMPVGATGTAAGTSTRGIQIPIHKLREGGAALASGKGLSSSHQPAHGSPLATMRCCSGAVAGWGSVPLLHPAVDQLEDQVKEVIEENERLRALLGDQAAILEQQQGPLNQSLAQFTEQRRLQGQLELLRQENDLLTAQQQELDQEIRRLHSQLESSGQTNLGLVSQTSALTSRIREMEAELQQVKRREGQAQKALQLAKDKSLAADIKLNQAKAELQEAQAEAATLRAALTSRDGSLETLKSELLTSRQQMAQHQEALTGAQLQLKTTRDRLAGVEAERDEAKQMEKELKQSVKSQEDKLREWHSREVEVMSRVRTAMEMAEEARTALDASVVVQRELERDVQELRGKLLAQGDLLRAQVQAEAQEELQALRQQLTAAQARVTQLESLVGEVRNAAEVCARDKTSLEGQLTSLRALLNQTTGGRMELGARDGAKARTREDEVRRMKEEMSLTAEHNSAHLQRLQKDWSMERRMLQQEARDLRADTNRLETEVTRARAEAAGYLHQLDRVTKELSNTQRTSSMVKATLENQVAECRRQHEEEVQVLVEKMSTTMRSCHQTVEAAERISQQKDGLLEKWKEEAQSLAQQLHQFSHDHEAQLRLKEEEVQRARTRLLSLQTHCQELEMDLQHWKDESEHLQVSLDNYECQLAACQEDVVNLTNLKDQLAEEARSLRFEQERMQLEHMRERKLRQVLEVKLERSQANNGC